MTLRNTDVGDAMRRLASELRAAYGNQARDRALTIAEAIAFEGNEEVAAIWEDVSRLV
jgi:hypothetical protein